MKKSMHFGNFNVTFGENFEPMLNRFFDIVYPALKDNSIKKVKKDSNGNKIEYIFNDVAIIDVEGEKFLVGNYIKNTVYNVFSQYNGKELINSSVNVPNAPYSRFIVFLKNHRMVFVKNESNSPSIKSFKYALEYALKTYVRKLNKDLSKKNKLPLPNVEIISLVMDESISEILSNVKKIQSFTLRFFPLNNDINPFPIINDVNQMIKENKSNSANLRFNSPESKESIEDIIKSCNGMFEPKLEVYDYDGDYMRITNDNFTSSKDVVFDRNLTSSDDSKIIAIANDNKKMHYISDENEKSYNKLIELIDKQLFSLDSQGGE